MEQVLASRSVSITELKRSPSAVLNHNRPAAYLLSPHVYQAMLEHLNADLRTEIQQGIESGDALPAEDVFAELNARYAEHGRLLAR